MKTKELVEAAAKEVEENGVLKEGTEIDLKTTTQVVQEIFRTIGTRLSEGDLKASEILAFVEKSASN